LYGDLYVVERDGNGAPVTKTFSVAGTDYVCQQPLHPSCSFLPLNGEKPDFNPELEDACAVQGTYAEALQPVVFGRESVSRSPATVLDHSYAEALNNINAAAPDLDCGGRAIKLDPAGRIELCLLADEATDTWAWKTIDSPLENLGLYRAVMTAGCLNPVTDTKMGEEGTQITVTVELEEPAIGYLRGSGREHRVCDGSTVITKKDMLSAAVFIAAGADKFAPVSLDQIINVNNALGVNAWDYATSRKTRVLTITYFQFKVADGPGGWFGYTKGFDACVPGAANNTVPLLVETTVSGTTPRTFAINDAVGVFGDTSDAVKLTGVTVCRNGLPLAVVCDDAPLDAGDPGNPVYSTSETNGCGGANWFTQAAEHARKTIWYLHNFEPPAVNQ
jgi:hypothetical protein